MTGMVTELDKPGAEIADNSTKMRRTCSVAEDEGSPVPELHRKKASKNAVETMSSASELSKESVGKQSMTEERPQPTGDNYEPSCARSLTLVTLGAQPMSATTFMELALDQAKFALDNLEVPVGCVIVEDGKVISSGSNRTNATRNATRHAEMEAIDVLLQEWQSIGLDQPLVAKKFAGCDLYVTCEPCIMCASALSILGIREVYFGCANDKFRGCGSVMSLHESLSSDDLTGSQDTRSRGYNCTGGIMAEEAVALFRNFYEQGNPNAPKPHRPVQVDQQ